MLLLFGTGAAVLVLLAIAARKAVGNPQSVGAALGSGAVDLGTGIVYGIGDGIGLPRTDQTDCEKALAEGRTWDASFACPAVTFVKSLFTTSPANTGGASGSW